MSYVSFHLTRATRPTNCMWAYKALEGKIYNCILFYNIHIQLGSYRPSRKKNNNNKKCFATSNLRVMTLSLSYLCLMSPFTLHGQHGLHSGSEPTNLKIEKITTVSYFIVYTINKPATGLARRKLIKNKKYFANNSLRGLTLSLSYLCLMSFLTYTGNTAYKLHVNLQTL